MKFKMIFFAVCLVLLMFLDAVARKVTVLEEITNPDSMRIGNGCIYIQEKTTIYIYDLESLRMVGKFGREGEGPGELRINPWGAPMVVTPHDNRVYVSSLAKLSIFTKYGDLIKESVIHALDTLMPLGEKYICFSAAPRTENSQEMVLSFFLASRSFKKEKLLYQTDFQISQNFDLEFPFTPFEPFVEENRFYLVDGIEGFSIKVFDPSGDMLYGIRKDRAKLKIPSSYRDKTMEWFQNDPNYKQLFNLLKGRIRFKKYYPAISTIQVDRGKIFVVTHARKNNERECLVMDLKGNEIKTVFLPIPEQFGLDFRMLFAFQNNTFYKIEENPDNENWELYRIEI